MSSHTLPFSKKQGTFVAINEFRTQSTETRPRNGRFSVHIDLRAVHEVLDDVRNWASNFFPWIRDDQTKKVVIKSPSVIPWLGLTALATSALTILASWLILHHIHNKEEILNKLFKPASWLSALLSLNSIALHIALTEGVSTAWWYQASRKDATVQESHDTWTFGTSLVAVLSSGRKFNYIAMATIFVATIPLNGLLLQNAISMESFTKINSTTLLVPVATSLPVGFSADFNNVTNIVGSPSDILSSVIYDTAGYSNARYAPATLWQVQTNPGCTNGKQNANCRGKARVVGFNATCRSEQPSYNLSPANFPANHTLNATVFSSNFSWQPSEPNVINMEVLWKPEVSCQDSYEKRSCRLEAASMIYPFIVYPTSQVARFGIDSSSLVGTLFQLDPISTFEDDEFEYIIPQYSNEGFTGTTYGGIASILQNRYNGYIDWTYNKTWSVHSVGSFAQSFTPTVQEGQEDFCFTQYWGQSQRQSSPAGLDIAGVLLDEVRSLMFAIAAQKFFWDHSVVTDDGDVTYPRYVEQSQRVNGTQSQAALRYNVNYLYWAASMAVTASIILVIAPTFYGFWTLARRTTLSPFETAAAFHAPILQGADLTKKTDVLLKEVGNRGVHEPIALPAATADLWQTIRR